jgi:hypothetical protein
MPQVYAIDGIVPVVDPSAARVSIFPDRYRFAR